MQTKKTRAVLVWNNPVFPSLLTPLLLAAFSLILGLRTGRRLTPSKSTAVSADEEGAINLGFVLGNRLALFSISLAFIFDAAPRRIPLPVPKPHPFDVQASSFFIVALYLAAVVLILFGPDLPDGRSKMTAVLGLGTAAVLILTTSELFIRGGAEADLQRMGDTVSISIGIHVMIPKADSSSLEHQELVRHADRALYQAKEEGRNRVCVFGADDPDPDTSAPDTSAQA